MQASLESLSPHETAVYTKMRAKLDATQPSAFREEFDPVMLEFVDIEPGDKWMVQAGGAVWMPRLPRHFRKMEKFLEAQNLRHKVDSLVVVAEREYGNDIGPSDNADDGRLYYAVADLWKSVFRVLDPERVAVVAPPSTLAALTETSTLSSDGWAFDMGWHYLELRQDRSGRLVSDMKGEKLGLQHSEGCARGTGPVIGTKNGVLIHARPWTHIGYNEGSSVPAYSTYEFHLKQAPKVLYLLLARLGKEAKACCNLRSLTFIAVFPFSLHIVTTLRALLRIQTLKHLKVQLAPGKENNVLGDRKRLGRAQCGDLWMEWDGCYSGLAGFLWSLGPGAEFCSEDGSNGFGGDNFRKRMNRMSDLNKLREPDEALVEWKEEEAGRWKRIDPVDEVR